MAGLRLSYTTLLGTRPHTLIAQSCVNKTQQSTQCAHLDLHDGHKGWAEHKGGQAAHVTQFPCHVSYTVTLSASWRA